MLPPASRVAISISAFSVITAVFERTAVSAPAGLGLAVADSESEKRNDDATRSICRIDVYGRLWCKRLGLVKLLEQTDPDD